MECEWRGQTEGGGQSLGVITLLHCTTRIGMVLCNSSWPKCCVDALAGSKVGDVDGIWVDRIEML